MSKRNITYVKPEDPSFLQKLKEEIGYKEGPTIETKRQKLEDFDNERLDTAADADERDDEKPQIVVIKAGDLTAEEAEAEKRRIEKEESEKPADLNQRIIFKAKPKAIDESSKKEKSEKKVKKLSTKQSHSKLSFSQDEDQDPEDD